MSQDVFEPPSLSEAEVQARLQMGEAAIRFFEKRHPGKGRNFFIELLEMAAQHTLVIEEFRRALGDWSILEDMRWLNPNQADEARNGLVEAISDLDPIRLDECPIKRFPVGRYGSTGVQEYEAFFECVKDSAVLARERLSQQSFSVSVDGSLGHSPNRPQLVGKVHAVNAAPSFGPGDKRPPGISQ